MLGGRSIRSSTYLFKMKLIEQDLYIMSDEVENYINNISYKIYYELCYCYFENTNRNYR